MKSFFNIPFHERIFGLDVLRAFAIVTVVYSHGENFLKPYIDSPVYQYFSIDGVTVFFVLSGFLIGKILIQTIEKHEFSGSVMLNFWKRRWYRTLPNYYLMLTFLVIYFDWMHHYSYKHSIRYFFFSQNFISIHPFFFGEAWSLAVEEWFYLLIPFVIFVWMKIDDLSVQTRFKSVIIYSILSIFLIKLIFIYHQPHIDLNTFYHVYRKLVIFRLDSIMIGVWGAYILIYHSDLWEKGRVLFYPSLAFMLMVHAWGLFVDFNSIFQSVAMRLFYTLLYSVAVLGMLPKMYFWRPEKLNGIHRSVIFISIISYSMYLINLTMFKSIFGPLYNNLTASWMDDGILRAFLKYFYYWMMVIFLSYLMYIFWEKRWMDLRKKYTVEHS